MSNRFFSPNQGTSDEDNTLTQMAGLQLLMDKEKLVSSGAAAKLEAVDEDSEKANEPAEESRKEEQPLDPASSFDVLAQELAVLNFSSSPFVKVESGSAERRSLRVSASFPGRHQTISRIYLVLNFPAAYPEKGSAPTFVVGKGTSLTRLHR